MLDLLYGQLSGREHDLPQQLSAMIDNQMERVLEAIVMERNPAANATNRLKLKLGLKLGWLADTSWLTII